MADPLTITLAAVTLATAIKDIFELVQKIRESASQISRNGEDSLRLSEDIVFTMRRIQEFCDNNPDTVENAELKTALIDMKREMQSVHNRIAGMLPSRLKNKLFIRMWLKIQAWRRQREVKEDIRELRDRVDRCHAAFTTSSVMRIEGKVSQLSTGMKNNVHKTSVQQGNAQLHESSLIQGVLHLRVTDQRLAALVGSGPVGNVNSSPELTGDLLSNLYIRFQLDRIEKNLVDLPTIQFSRIENPSERYLRPFVVHGTLGVWDGSVVSDGIVVDTHRIQQIIRAGFTSLSVQEAAWEMGRLSAGLYDLDMDAEAATTGHWTVQLFRVLVNVNYEVYAPYLTQALLDLSDFYGHACDAAQSAVLESYTHIQKLLADNPSNREFVILQSRILTTLGRLAWDSGNQAEALQSLEEAIITFETLLQPCIIGDTLATQTLDDFWNGERMYLALRDYSRVLGSLSDALRASHRFDDAANAAKKAITVIRIIMVAHPECYMETELADILHQLSDPDFSSIIEIQDAHIYAKEGATIYRKLYNRDPQTYGLDLYDALRRLANILEQMDDRSHAVLVWREMTDLARRITHNQELLVEALDAISLDLHLLQRYDEAATFLLESVKTYRTIHKSVSIDEANGHYDIALALHCAGRPQDALPRAEEAVVQYRSLAFNDPDKYLPYLARGLEQLSEILNDTSNYLRAFSEGHESLKLYQSIMSRRPDILKSYMQCLATNMRISCNLCHPTKSIELGKDVIHQFRQLGVQYPTEIGLKAAEAVHTSAYSLLLYNLDKIPESLDWCTQSLELYKSHTLEDAGSFEGQMTCLINLNLYLWTQGNFNGALEHLEKAIKIGEEQEASYPSLLLPLIDAKERHANVLCDLGRYSEALENVNALCCRTSASSNIGVHICSLIQSSVIYRLNGNPEGAIKAARTAIQICCARQSIPKHHAWSLQELGEGLADNGMEAEAQEMLEELESMDSDWKSSRDALWGHSFRLFAKGKLLDDTDLMRLKKSHEKEKRKGPGYGPRLARALWMLGIFYCAQGRHDEGQTAATELKKLTMQLMAYPEPAGATERMLAYERNRPFWKATLAKLDLTCHHQDNC